MPKMVEYYDNDGNKFYIPTVATAKGALISVTWTGAGNTGAPDPELYGDNEIGADLDGISTALTYHVQGAGGSKVWTPTGATVKNLYGGA